MTTYFVCLLVGLFGVAVVFTGRESKARMTIGAALYFIALFWAAIHSLNGALI